MSDDHIVRLGNTCNCVTVSVNIYISLICGYYQYFYELKIKEVRLNFKLVYIFLNFSIKILLYVCFRNLLKVIGDRLEYVIQVNQG